MQDEFHQLNLLTIHVCDVNIFVLSICKLRDKCKEVWYEHREDMSISNTHDASLLHAGAKMVALHT